MAWHVQGRRCAFESLENRQMLAGDVTAQIVNGDLVIGGDNLDNGITIAAGATAGTVVITGVNAGGTATNVNGTANGSVTLSGFTDDLRIRMRGGNDAVTITGLTVPDNADLEGGSGNDTFTISGSTFNGELELELGTGNDTATLTNVTVNDEAEVEGGSGDDSVTVTGSNFDEFEAEMGRGNDSVNISGTTVDDETEIEGGRGTDTFTNGTGNSLGDLDLESITQTTSSTAPTLSISGPATINEGALYTLNLSATGTGATTITQWTINWGDGSVAQVVTGNPTSVTHTYTDGPATRTISATATNPSGTFNAGNTVAATVNNVAPALTLSGAASVNEGALYTLTLARTDPGADTITQWTINWGDGSAAQVVTGNPTSVTHTFTDGPATRTISATATDEDGTFNAGNTVAVTVNNVVPTLTLSGAASVNEGALYTLNLARTDPGADTITQWVINWGDGSAPQTVTGNPSSVTHTFADGGATRTISATATDEDGTFNAGNTVAVTVNNVAPTLALSGAASVDEGALYTLNLSSTDPGTDTITQWNINWGDGTPIQTVTGNPASVTHTFVEGPATRTISATATDEDGTFTAGNTVAVTVNNVAPSAPELNGASITENSAATLTGTYSDTGLTDAHTVVIDWADPNVVANSTFAIPAIQNAAGTPTLTVGDTFSSSTDGAVVEITGIISTGAFAGRVSFSVQHNYMDDGEVGGNATGFDASAVQVTVTDDDGASGNVSTSITVNDEAAAISLDIENNLLENDVLTLEGSFTDIGIRDAHSLVVQWDDPNNSLDSTFAIRSIRNAAGVATLAVNDVFNSSTDTATLTITAIDVATGEVGFSVQHRYLDDGESPGDSSSTYNGTIVVTVTDDDGESNSGLAGVEVTNVAPTITLDPVASVLENGLATLRGSYTDIGLLDAHTLNINWGDVNAGANSSFAIARIKDAAGNILLEVNDTFSSSGDSAVLTITSVDTTTGQVGFTVQHRYLDDGGAPGNGLETDTLTISATVFDDDTQNAATSRFVNVSNVAPTVSLSAVAGVLENGTLTLEGSFTDIGKLDVHTVTVNWADPNDSDISTFVVPGILTASGAATFPVGTTFSSTTDNAELTITSINTSTGEVGFSVQHQFLDDGKALGNDTESDTSAISVSVTDDDGGSASSTRLATISNASPSLALDEVTDIFVNGTATLTGSYADTGELDAQTLSVQWGDLSTGSTFAIRAVRNAAGTNTLIPGNTFESTTDDAVLTITFFDEDTRRVGFSVSHQYTSTGTKNITVDIVDDDLGADSEGVPVLVSNPIV